MNRIAAGEVIQRPSNALKELLENALDAGSRHVTVTVAQGGIRLLRVQDDGCGVSRADLPLLCERHATSKLVSAGDLAHLATFGFRGEALASMSFAAHVTVITRRRGEGDCGYKATYRDGKLFPPTNEGTGEVEVLPSLSTAPAAATIAAASSPLLPPCSANPALVAAQPGTTVEIRDLFFAAPLRRKALKSPAAEYDAILDVVRRYAVFRPDVSFVARREGEARPDVATIGGARREDVIRQVFGRDAARGLVDVRCTLGGGCAWGDDGIKGAQDDEVEEDGNGGGGGGGGGEDAGCARPDPPTPSPPPPSLPRSSPPSLSLSPAHRYALDVPICSVRGLASGPEREHRKTVLVAFVNGRPVEWASLRRALEASYAAVVQKTVRPFVFLSVRVPATHVDVNVHPTKRDVGLLFAGDVTRAVCAAVEDILCRGNATRTFVQQSIRGTSFAPQDHTKGDETNAEHADLAAQETQGAPAAEEGEEGAQGADAEGAEEATQGPDAGENASRDGTQGEGNVRDVQDTRRVKTHEATAQSRARLAAIGGEIDAEANANANAAPAAATPAISTANVGPSDAPTPPRADSARSVKKEPLAPSPLAASAAPRLSPSPLAPPSASAGRPRPSPSLHPASKDSPVPYRPEKLVRVDARARTLRAFLSQASPPHGTDVRPKPEPELDSDAPTNLSAAFDLESDGRDADRADTDALTLPAASPLASFPPVPPVRPGAGKRTRTGGPPSALSSFFADAGNAGGVASDADVSASPAPFSLASSADPARLDAELNIEAADRARAARATALDLLNAPSGALRSGASRPALDRLDDAAQLPLASQSVALPLGSMRVARAPAGTTPALRSAERLLSRLQANSHPGVREALSNASLVGGLCTGQALVQSGTRLLCLAVAPLVSDLCHQRVLERVGEVAALPEVRFSPPLDLETLLRIAIADEREDEDDENDDAEAELAEELTQLLAEKAALLQDHVGIRIEALQGSMEDARNGEAHGKDAFAAVDSESPSAHVPTAGGATVTHDEPLDAENVTHCEPLDAENVTHCESLEAANVVDGERSNPASLTNGSPKAPAAASAKPPSSAAADADKPEQPCVVVTALPAPVPGLPVAADRLPRLVLDLAVRVPWDDEERCFEGIAAALAEFWAWGPYLRSREEDEEEKEGEQGTRDIDAKQEPRGTGNAVDGVCERGDKDQDPNSVENRGTPPKANADGVVDSDETAQNQPPIARCVAPEEDPKYESDRWTLEHVAIPALREGFWPPRARLADHSVFEVTRLERLYRVFERC